MMIKLLVCAFERVVWAQPCFQILGLAAPHANCVTPEQLHLSHEALHIYKTPRYTCAFEIYIKHSTVRLRITQQRVREIGEFRGCCVSLELSRTPSQR
jgi:hypothetical protein